jgi:uncharacterized membrane protein (DUF485 family)
MKDYAPQYNKTKHKEIQAAAWILTIIIFVVFLAFMFNISGERCMDSAKGFCT